MGGTWNKFTWMHDFDASGRLKASTQVLYEANFHTVRPGMSRDDVLYQIGHPADARVLGRQQQDLWSYRYDNVFC
ncbi:hypothetical protein DN554_30690, partial [Burkholderia multivorans]